MLRCAAVCLKVREEEDCSLVNTDVKKKKVFGKIFDY